MNLKMAPQVVTSEQMVRLTDNARGLLQRLYRLLLAPMQQALNRYPKLLVVPHGPLHYLPFHALHDGEGYFVQRHEISYLPSASFLRYSREVKPATSGALIYGNSWHGKLPNTLHEVEVVANIFNERALVEDEVTVAQLPQLVANARLVHLATHGDFRSDNPLFSGLTIGDGWLTTLDLFNLRLRASLVTLSGCQTGRNVVQGGDELSGLMRALLSAGAASLVLTLWSVEDQATARFMAVMYNKLATGYTKGAALQAAQLQFIEEIDQGDARSPLNHPYFWAPFFLVGDPGSL
jgi:CHAT domain-containing protein